VVITGTTTQKTAVLAQVDRPKRTTVALAAGSLL